MDYSRFLDDDFDVKEWINSAFKSQEESGQTPDQLASSVVMKLQMLIQELNGSIDEASLQAIQSLPGILRDIELVKHEALLLQDEMKSVKTEIEQIQKETSNSIEELLELDQVKSRMNQASSALKEADNWSTLSSEIEELFEKQDIDAISNKLSRMQQSLNMLSHVPDYQQRCEHLELLKNRLEALVTPRMMASFGAQMTDQLKIYYTIFEEMERVNQFQNYYITYKKKLLLETMRNKTEMNESIETYLTLLYMAMFEAFQKEIDWCIKLFTNPFQIAIQLLTDVYKEFSRTVADRIRTAVEAESNKFDKLIRLQMIVEDFLKKFKVSISVYSQDSSDSTISALTQSLFTPFVEFKLRYKEYVEQGLNEEMEGIKLDHEDFSKCCQLLSSSLHKAIQPLQEAEQTCRKFCYGACYREFLRIAKDYLTNYLNEFRRVVKNLRERQRSKREDYEENWDLFQKCLQVVQICGEIVFQVQSFYNSLEHNIVATLGDIFADDEREEVFVAFLPTKEKESLKSFYLSIQEEGIPKSNNLQSLYAKVCEEANLLTHDVVVVPVQHFIAVFRSLDVWMSQRSGGALTELPAFSLSPQEYITKIGQYLMTLPQALEPYAEQNYLLIGVQTGKLPLVDNDDSYNDITSCWLISVAKMATQLYSDEILKLQQLSENGCKQLVVDVEYLCNVLEDLDLQPIPSLLQIRELLMCPNEEFNRQRVGKSDIIVETIRALRKL